MADGPPPWWDQPALRRRKSAGGAQIYYSLAEPADKVFFKILDIEGKTLSQWTTRPRRDSTELLGT